MKKSAKAKRSAKPKSKPKTKASSTKKRVQSLGPEFHAQSKRLAVRLIEAGDEDLYCGLYTDAKTMKDICPPLSPERAKASFDRVLARSTQKPWVQRISVVVERKRMRPIGIASIKMIDTEKRIAEVGILLKPNAAGHRYATEASQTLISSAFRRYAIEGITAQIPVGHKVGEKLVATLGYTKAQDIAATPGHGARTGWAMSRENWANTYK